MLFKRKKSGFRNRLTGSLFLLYAFFLLIAVSGCRKEQISISRPLLGTVINVTVKTDSSLGVKAVNSAFEEVARIQALFSYYNQDTDIARLNRSGGQSMVKLSPEVYNLLALSIDISRKTSGAFDITFVSAGYLWDLKSEKFIPPSEKSIIQALKFVGYRNIKIDNANKEAGFFMEGVRADMGGIAKGYAISRAVQILRGQGIKSGFVDAGGDIQVIGDNSGKPWIIGVKNPEDSGIIGTIALSGEDSIATSGAYERFREYNGKRYHHILDPRSGYPADSGLLSVSVICSDPVLADAYATAFFVMGFNKTSKFLAENSGISVILVDDKGKIFVSRKLKGKVKFKNEYSVQYF